MFCANCGGPVDPGAGFCGRCGASLQAAGILLPPMSQQAPVAVMAGASTAVPPLIVSVNPPAASTQVAPRSNSAGIAAWILLVFACAGALLPGLGFAMWLIIGPILFITLILGVMAISNGRTGSGVMIILMSLVVVPVFVLVAPFASTVLAVGAAASSVDTVSPSPDAPAEGAVPAGGILSMPENPAALEPTEATPPAEDAALESTPGDFVANPEPLPASAAPAMPAQSQAQAAMPEPAPGVQAARISASVDYAVLRTQPTLFSRGLGRLRPGTEVTLGAPVAGSHWTAASTADGRSGFLDRRDLDGRDLEGRDLEGRDLDGR